jgi:anti-repressor protein
MNEIIRVNNDTQTVSARELHEKLGIKTAFKDWMPRMIDYGFEEGKDFSSFLSESTGGRPSKDYEISIDMAKQICMIQRTPVGKQIREYFIDLEKAWNTPEQVMARALRIADKTIDGLKIENKKLIEENNELKPKALFADCVSASNSTILIGELAKILKANGVDIGQNRLFAWMRDNGYLIRRKGTDYNMPTQRAMELGLFKIKETIINKPEGSIAISKTVKITGKGQSYFINKFIQKQQVAIG